MWRIPTSRAQLCGACRAICVGYIINVLIMGQFLCGQPLIQACKAAARTESGRNTCSMISWGQGLPAVMPLRELLKS